MVTLNVLSETLFFTASGGQTLPSQLPSHLSATFCTCAQVHKRHSGEVENDAML